MANTYSQIHIQIVLVVADRDAAIKARAKAEIEKYITGIISNYKQKLLAISCMPDHCHILIGLRPSCNISDLVREVKKSSTNFINSKKLVMGKFFWQEGYAAFSYSKSEIARVISYIMKQEQHHRKSSFREEYLELLKRAEIEYEDKYLFNFWE